MPGSLRRCTLFPPFYARGNRDLERLTCPKSHSFEVLDPGHEPRHIGPITVHMLNSCALQERAWRQRPLFPVSWVALGWSLTSLTLHFLARLLGDSKTEMHAMYFATFEGVLLTPE